MCSGTAHTAVRTLLCEADKDWDENQNLVQDHEDAGRIEIDILPFSGLSDELIRLESEGFAVRSTLYGLAHGLQLSSSLFPSSL